MNHVYVVATRFDGEKKKLNQQKDEEKKNYRQIEMKQKEKERKKKSRIMNKRFP